ncbi:hypothetical protein GQ457_13G006980 [Hibiscus cannabinus]
MLPGSSSVVEIWNEILVVRPKVPWQKLVWYGLHVPKYSVILWMAILDRLPTLDRLRNMGLNVDASCILCTYGHESRNHLFAECVFSQQIWKVVLSLCMLNRDMLDWEGEERWLYTHLKGKSLSLLGAHTFIIFGRKGIKENFDVFLVIVIA